MKKHKIGKVDIIIDGARCDNSGCAPMTYIVVALLKAATQHAQGNLFGFDEMANLGKTWVLSRMGVYVTRYPKHDEPIRVETWISDVQSIFTRRNFALIDQDNEAIVTAQSYWAAIDLETRRPTNLLDINDGILKEYIIKREEYETPIMKRIAGVESEPIKIYYPQYSDIDINTHFSSIKYIEHAINTFGEELLTGSIIRDMSIVYSAETFPGTPIAFCKKDHLIEIKNHETGNSICRIDFTID